MLDFGWQELMVVGFVLVLVIGPKDMPKVMRVVARFLGKAQAMAREFQSSMIEVADQDELKSVKQALDDAKNLSFTSVAQPLEYIKRDIENYDDSVSLKKPPPKKPQKKAKKKAALKKQAKKLAKKLAKKPAKKALKKDNKV